MSEEDIQFSNISNNDKINDSLGHDVIVQDLLFLEDVHHFQRAVSRHLRQADLEGLKEVLFGLVLAQYAGSPEAVEGEGEALHDLDQLFVGVLHQ